MPPDHTYEAFSTDALETELFLEGIFRDDWQNPATTIWIVAFLESYLSSGSLDAATTVSEYFISHLFLWTYTDYFLKNSLQLRTPNFRAINTL